MLKVSKQDPQNRTNPPPLVAKQKIASFLQILHLITRLRGGSKSISLIPTVASRVHMLSSFTFSDIYLVLLWQLLLLFSSDPLRNLKAFQLISKWLISHNWMKWKSFWNFRALARLIFSVSVLLYLYMWCNLRFGGIQDRFDLIIPPNIIPRIYQGAR